MLEGKVISPPELSEWVCYPFGKQESYNVMYRPVKGQEPNAFHRLMQKLFFGIHWEKRQNEQNSKASEGSNGV
jgi:hypothetical protein